MADLQDLLADPSRVRTLTSREVAAASSDLAQRQLELTALQLALQDRLRVVSASGAASGPPAQRDRLLTAEELADRLRTTVRYVYRNASKWPFTRRLGRKKLLFSEAGLTRYLEQTRP